MTLALRIVANYESDYLFFEVDAMQHYVYEQSKACDLSAPKSLDFQEYELQEAVTGFLIAVRLVQPFEDMHARLAALHPRANALRTLVFSSGLQLREGSKLASLSDPDYCALVHAWKDRQWSHSFPETYYYGVLGERGVNVTLMRQQEHRAFNTFFACRSSG